MQKVHPAIGHGLPSASFGFSHYVLFVYEPRTDRTVRFVNHVRGDHKFPHHILARDVLDIYVRHRCYWHRDAAREVWQRYLQWKRAQTEEAA